MVWRDKESPPWFWAVMGVLLIAMVGMLAATPTLNFDDLGYPGFAEIVYAQKRFGRALLDALINADLGVNEIRTYGLTRTLQIIFAFVLGGNPVTSYILLSCIHFASGIAVFYVLRAISKDTVLALLSAFIWMASPAALPLLKNFHHYMYLVLPFAPLMVWMYLAVAGRCTFWIGTALLTLTWALGEAALIPMGATVVLAALARRDRSLIFQGAAALTLLALYVGYQKIFVNDPSLAQRFSYHMPPPEHVHSVLLQIWENGKAVIGQSYFDGEQLARINGVNPWRTAATLLALAAGAIAFTPVALKARREDLYDSRNDGHRAFAFIFATLCPLSLVLYVIAAGYFGTGLAVRYTAPFYALLPLSLIACAWVVSPRGARVLAGVLATASIALSLGLLDRAETLVNRPNRELLARLQPGTAIVAVHNGWRRSPEGDVGGDYPGLVSPHDNGLANPLRAAWSTAAMLRLYSGVTFATACTRQADNRIEVVMEGRKRLFAEPNVRAVGLPERDASVPIPLELEDVCGTEAHILPHDVR